LVFDGGETGVHIYLFIIILRPYIFNLNGAHCGVFGSGTEFQVEIPRVRIPVGLSGILTYSLRPHCGPGVDTASNTNEWKGCHLGIKVTVCGADNCTTFVCRLPRNSGSLKLLQD
jgi:hypothetical protein